MFSTGAGKPGTFQGMLAYEDKGRAHLRFLNMNMTVGMGHELNMAVEST
jgi:hypothetical protein